MSGLYLLIPEDPRITWKPGRMIILSEYKELGMFQSIILLQEDGVCKTQTDSRDLCEVT